MINWDTLVLAPTHAAFGDQEIPYSVAGAPAIFITGIFDEAALSLDALGPPNANALLPVLGVRMSQFPADWDPRNARGDTFTVRGRTYVVQNGKPDSHGGARLEAKRQ